MGNLKNIHETADVKSPEIGERTRIWQYVVVLTGAKIGSDVNICSHFYEVDPLECAKCNGPMRVIALIEDPGVIRRML